MPARDETLLTRARANRAAMPITEARLWERLRALRLDGVKFARQVPIDPYIADFCARREKLIIEVDGDSHANRVGYDASRTHFLEAQGYRVIRFDNDEVKDNLNGVLEAILRALGRL
jgi:very-short-patch-repair endonuclease